MSNSFLIPAFFLISCCLSGQQINSILAPEDDTGMELLACRLFSAQNNREEDILPDYLKDGKIVLSAGDCCLNMKMGKSTREFHNEFIYRLEGFSPNWFTCKESSIELVSLPYGDFTLAIRAKRVDGYFSRRELRIPITVLRPYYLQSWFLGMVSFAGVIGFLAFLKYWNISFTKRIPKKKFFFRKEKGNNSIAPEVAEEELVSIPKLTTRQEAWLQQLKDLTYANIGNHDFTISHLAKLMLMGESNFYRQVQELTRLTPNQYIREIRMTKAQELLRMKPELAVKELAHAVGMKDVKYFSLLFKQRFGMVPSEYAER